MRTCLIFILVVGALAAAPTAQSVETMARMENEFRIVPNVTYHTASNVDLKVDLYLHAGRSQPRPTLIFYHGGGWLQGAKEERLFALLPYLAMGMNVVNVQYRLAKVALAPAAVEDARCALKWVLARSKEYGFDPEKIVTAGDSAGAHLALMAAFLPTSAGLDYLCVRMPGLPLPNPVSGEMKVAAVINWYGLPDVHELVSGPNMKEYTVSWLGGARDREEIATRVSPMTYIRAGLPPVFTIHGDADQSAPYATAVRLHKALTDKGVPNELMTIPGGGHGLGCCNLEQRTNAYLKIESFLKKNGVLPAQSTKAP